MKASEWIAAYTAKPLTVTGECSLQDAARILLDAPQSRDLFVLGDDDKVCGHLGLWHLSTLLLAKPRPSQSLRELVEQITPGCVADHMDDRVMCARADENVDEILYRHDLFQQHVERRVEDIPVVDDQRRMLGVIRLSDLLGKALETMNSG